MNDEVISGTEIADSESMKKVFTIGHSTLALDSFLNLLKMAGTTVIADVRSSPFSLRLPHFSRDEFRASLKKVGIKYVFLGKELGGRPRANHLYCNGVADYEKMALESDFLKGLDRVVNGSKEHIITLMCSEHNPLDCHRCLLVGRALAERKISLEHVLSNGSIASQYEIEEKLLALASAGKKDMKDMFATREELLSIAYRSRAKAVAYREPIRELTESTAVLWPDHAP